jgi:NAD(P)-dependent dehydrogenase (short-subunit alcohol dehydrogenase family)
MNQQGRLSGRGAIVTGGGQGIGRAIATAFAAEGAGLVLVDQTAETLQDAATAIGAGGTEVRTVQGSVSDRATADRAVSEALDAFGRVDVVVNCAHSYTPHASMETIPEEDFRKELDTGFFGSVHLMQAAFAHMKDQGGGSIINFGSQVALQGDPKRATYSATKEAIRGMTRSAARDWGQYNVRVNVICPMALTPAVEERVDPKVLEQVVATTSVGYIGKPDDVAPTAVFLASDEARYVTGQTINVDGGRFMF